MGIVLECVVNVSEGRDEAVIAALAEAAGASLLDVHVDAHHHRSVLTLAGPAVETAVREVSRQAVARIDLRRHQGAHPRLGALDVVPFVPLGGSDLGPAIAARDRFAAWAAEELELPCFLYGPERTLPDVRRSAFVAAHPDVGPPRPHLTAGAAAVGARPVLMAYNLWLAPGVGLGRAREVARLVRRPGVRTLGLAVGDAVQVSCNLTAPVDVGPDVAFDAVATLVPVARAELVGLVPSAVLGAIPEDRWAGLDLDPSRTIEARLERAGLSGGTAATGPAS